MTHLACSQTALSLPTADSDAGRGGAGASAERAAWRRAGGGPQRGSRAGFRAAHRPPQAPRAAGKEPAVRTLLCVNLLPNR